MRRVAASAGLVAKDLCRNRVAAALLLILPTVFYLLIWITTGDRPIPFQLRVAGPEALAAAERDLATLFIGMASICGVSAFLTFVLVHRPTAADRRLVFEGFSPAELLLAKAAVAAGAAVVVTTYVSALLPLFFRPQRPGVVFAGFLSGALVYAAVGMGVGALVKRELEGILAILLLVNLDPGWLQSPVFYANAHNRELIRWLPGHHPGQVVMAGAFTDLGLTGELLAALSAAGAALLLAGGLYWARVRVWR